MHKLLYVTAFALCIAALALAISFVFAPLYANSCLSDYVTQQYNLPIKIKKDAYLEFLPSPTIRLEGISLESRSQPTPHISFLAEAEAIHIPVSLWDLLTRRMHFSEIILSGASFRLSDAQTQEIIYFNNFSGTLRFDQERALIINGIATLNGHLTQLNSYIKSLDRITLDGSPTDLTLTRDDLRMSFSGRLNFNEQLELVGQLALESGPQRLTLNADIDGNDHQIGFKNTVLMLDNNKFTGQLSAEKRQDASHWQANLAVSHLDLSTFSMMFANDTGWNREPLNWPILRKFDVDFVLNAEKITHAAFSSGPTEISGQLSASGANIEELIGTLRGPLLLKLKAISIAAISASFSQTEAKAHITDGLMIIDSFKLPKLEITGEIDLLRRAFNMVMVSGSKPLPIKIIGPWNMPKFISEKD